MHPPTKLHLQIFYPEKGYSPLSPLVLSRFISSRLFSVPLKLKGLQFADVAEIQEAVTDELKKV